MPRNFSNILYQNPMQYCNGVFISHKPLSLSTVKRRKNKNEKKKNNKNVNVEKSFSLHLQQAERHEMVTFLNFHLLFGSNNGTIS